MVLGDAVVLGHDHEHLELLSGVFGQEELGLSVQITTMGEHVEHTVCRDSRVRVANNGNQEVEEDDLDKEDVDDPDEPYQPNHCVIGRKANEIFAVVPVLVGWTCQISKWVPEDLQEVGEGSIDLILKIRFLVLLELGTEQLECNREKCNPVHEEHHESDWVFEGHVYQLDLCTDSLEDSDVEHGP